jgi:hypothetical protein
MRVPVAPSFIDRRSSGGGIDMKRILGMLCVAAAIAAAAGVRAQVAPVNPTYVFTTIDAVARQSEAVIYLTGVLEGASGPTQILLRSYSSSVGGIDACERSAVMLMTKPGQYRLEAWAGSISALTYCRLVKLNP